VFDESGGAPLESYILGRTPDGTLPFGAVFGMMTFQGMRKAAFNGFKMLNYTGSKRLQVSGGTGSKDGVDGMATVSADGRQVQIIVYNYYATIAQTGSDNVTVTLNNLPFAGKEAYVARFAIDETHANPYSIWLGQNKPTKPDEKQWQAMRKAQHLMPVEPVAKKTMEDTYTATFAVPKQGSAMILIGLDRPLTGRDAKVEIEGEDYDGQSGATREESGDTSVGQSISAAANSWVYFENVDYSDQGVDSVDLRVKNAADTSVELRTESETGTLLGKCALKSTANAWATQTCKLSSPATGVSKLYVLFAGAAHLNWLKFAGVANAGTGGTGGNSGSPDGGAAGSSGTAGSGAGGKGGTGGGGNAGSSGSAGMGGSVSSRGGGTGGSASSSVAGAGSGGASNSSGSGGARQSSSGGDSSSKGGSSVSPSSGGSGSSGGSSGQGSSKVSGSSSAASGGSSGCGCRLGGTGDESRGVASLLGILLGVLMGRRRNPSEQTRSDS
jgi:MYXO-CTERM domain-containing protein